MLARQPRKAYDSAGDWASDGDCPDIVLAFTAKCLIESLSSIKNGDLTSRSGGDGSQLLRIVFDQLNSTCMRRTGYSGHSLYSCSWNSRSQTSSTILHNVRSIPTSMPHLLPSITGDDLPAGFTRPFWLALLIERRSLFGCEVATPIALQRSFATICPLVAFSTVCPAAQCFCQMNSWRLIQ